jgi:hypothetical protein
MNKDSFIQQLEDHRKALLKGSLSDALIAYKDLLEQHPNRRSDVLRSRSLTREYYGDLVGAIGDLRQAIETGSTRIAADLFTMAGLLIQNGRFEESLETMSDLELEESGKSDYFVSSTPLMKAYCLANLSRHREALLLLNNVADDSSVSWIENIPEITPDLIRRLCASSGTKNT